MSDVAPPTSPAVKPLSTNALISLALFALGFLLPLVLHAMGLVFGILGVRETGADGRARGRGLAVLGVVINGIAVTLACVLVVVVIWFGLIKGQL